MSDFSEDSASREEQSSDLSHTIDRHGVLGAVAAARQWARRAAANVSHFLLHSSAVFANVLRFFLGAWAGFLIGNVGRSGSPGSRLEIGIA